jgi:PRC-barrel domain
MSVLSYKKMECCWARSIENPVLATCCFSLFLGASHTLQKIAEKLTGVRAAPAGWDDLPACAPHRFRTPREGAAEGPVPFEAAALFQEAAMRAHRKIGRKRALGATSLWDACYEPYGHRRARVSPRTRILLTFITIMAIIGLLLIVANPKPVLSQGVQLIQVDVNVVAHGYRVSKLTGSSVTNEKNEKIGTLDDFVVARNRSLFAVLQIGGFLGMGVHLVAVPYDSLVIDHEGSKIQLPGASKDELKKLTEFKYRG